MRVKGVMCVLSNLPTINYFHEELPDAPGMIRGIIMFTGSKRRGPAFQAGPECQQTRPSFRHLFAYIPVHPSCPELMSVQHRAVRYQQVAPGRYIPVYRRSDS